MAKRKGADPEAIDTETTEEIQEEVQTEEVQPTPPTNLIQMVKVGEHPIMVHPTQVEMWQKQGWAIAPSR